MKKKFGGILSFVVIVFMSMLLVLSVNAEQSSVSSLNVDYENGSLNVSGIIDNGWFNQDLTLLILYPGTDINNIHSGDIVCMNQTTAYLNVNQQITFDFKSFLMPQNAPLGIYTIMVSGNFLTSVTQTFKKGPTKVIGEVTFAEQPNSQDIITNLNGKVSAYPKITLENGSDNKSICIGVALYSEKNQLQKISYKEKTLSGPNTVINDVGITDISSHVGWYVKSFVWDSKTNLKPLASSSVVSHNIYNVDALTVRELQTRMWDAVIMRLGQNYAYVRNSKQYMDELGTSVPYKINESALVPISFLANSLNSSININETERTATLYYMQNEYVFTNDSNVMSIVNPNGSIANPVVMSANTQKIDGNIYIPLSDFAQAAGFLYGFEADGVVWFSHTNLFAVKSGIDNNEIRKAIYNLFSEGFKKNLTQAEYYVDPVVGADTNNGTLTSAFKTIEHTRDVVRSQIATQGMNGNIIVYLRGGDYYFTQPIQFTEQDSGKNGYKVIYKAYNNEEPILNGGSRVEGWETVDANIYKTYVGTNKVFHTVFENGVYGTKARYPNRVGTSFPNTTYSKAVAVNDTSGVPLKNKFMFNTGDVPSVANPSELEVSIWAGGVGGDWRWFQEFIKVSGIDYTNKVVTLNKNAGYNLGTGSFYFVQGAKELLDAPGEFYLSTDGYLYYWPMNLPIANQEIVIPVTNGIIKLNGTDENNIIRDISFEGLTLQNTERSSIDNPTTYGYDNAAVQVNNAAWLSFDRIRARCISSSVVYFGIANIGGWAQNNSVTNSEMYNLGRDGIVINGMQAYKKVQAEDDLQRNSIINRYNVIYNNNIYNVGGITGHGAPISAFSSAYNYIGHNKVQNCTRNGIGIADWKPSLVGMTLGGVKVTFDNVNTYINTRFNVLEYNDVSQCFTDSQDVGAIATGNIGLNNIIRNNLVYNNTVPSSHANVIYLDDDSGGSFLYDNVIYDNGNKPTVGRIDSAFVSKGIGNQLFNNIAANNKLEGFIYTAPMGNFGINHDVISERNVTYNSGNALYKLTAASGANASLPANAAESRFASSDYNVFYNEMGTYNMVGSGLPRTFNFGEWRSWQKGKYETQTIIDQNPQFVNPQGFDYRFRYDSPVYKQGIRDINIKDMGLTADFPSKDNSDPVEKVFIAVKDKTNNSYIDIKSGNKAQITVKARTTKGFMINISSEQLQYSINNESIAKITASGEITGYSTGIATLTATVTLNGVQKSTEFHILVNDTYDDNSFNLSFPTNTLQIGEKRQINASIKTVFGKQVAINGVTLTSDKPGVLSVDSNGYATALTVGTATITANYNLEGKSLSSSLVITVTDALHQQDFDNKTIFPIDQKISNYLPYVYVGSNQAYTRYQNGSTGNSVLEFKRSDQYTGNIGIKNINQLNITGSFVVEGYYRFLNPTWSNPIFVGISGGGKSYGVNAYQDGTIWADNYNSAGVKANIPDLALANPNNYYGIRLSYYKGTDGCYWYDLYISNPINVGDALLATTWTKLGTMKTMASSIDTILLAQIYNTSAMPSTPTTVYVDNFSIK